MIRICWCFGFSLALAGCSSIDKAPESQMVQGTIAMRDGRKITSGRINFFPVEHSGPVGWADIRKDGTFRFQEGDGIPVGRYRVTIEGTTPRADAARVEPETIEVAEGTNQFSFKVRPD